MSMCVSIYACVCLSINVVDWRYSNISLSNPENWMNGVEEARTRIIEERNGC